MVLKLETFDEDFRFLTRCLNIEVTLKANFCWPARLWDNACSLLVQDKLTLDLNLNAASLEGGKQREVVEEGDGVSKDEIFYSQVVAIATFACRSCLRSLLGRTWLCSKFGGFVHLSDEHPKGSLMGFQRSCLATNWVLVCRTDPFAPSWVGQAQAVILGSRYSVCICCARLGQGYQG